MENRNVVTRVSKREFLLYPSKWLKEVPIVITHRGDDMFEVRRASNVVTSKEKIVVTTDNVVTKDRLRYGCGCERGEGNLCKKHGRV